MKKIGKYIPRILLLDTAVFMAMAVTALFVIKAFHMTFREWVFFAAGAIILLGTIAGVIQLTLKWEKRSKKILWMAIFGIILLFASPVIYFIAVLSYTPEHVVERDGKRYVAYVKGFRHADVSYYDYINAVVVGDRIRIREVYKQRKDPLENPSGCEYEIQSTIYYDENGNAIE